MFALAGSIVSGVYNSVFGAAEENDSQPNEPEEKSETDSDSSVPIQNLKIHSKDPSPNQPTTTTSLPHGDIENENSAFRSRPNNENLSLNAPSNAPLFSSYSFDRQPLSTYSTNALARHSTLSSPKSAFRKVESPVKPLSHTYTHSPARVTSPMRLASPSRHPHTTPNKISSQVLAEFNLLGFFSSFSFFSFFLFFPLIYFVFVFDGVSCFAC
jgi:hypothetical protein